jgi:glycosyltransferase involved in cell wall biosynthesis
MPVHNCAPFLPASLDSLLAQQDVALEIIAVNDGSTDASLAVLREAERADRRVVVIDQPNRGPAAARNTGLEAARGEWVAFADADDWVAPGTFAEWHRRACADKLDVLIGNGYRFKADPRQEPVKPLLRHQARNQVMSGPEWIVRCMRHNEWPHYVWLQFIRRTLIRQHRLRFVPALLHEDIPWTLQLALAARRIGFASRPLYGYRSNPASIVNTPSQAAIARRANSYAHIVKMLVNAAAAHHRDASLQRALLRHANEECVYFDQLLRKKLYDRQLRRKTASLFHDMNVWPALLRGARGARQYRRLARCYLAVSRLRR